MSNVFVRKTGPSKWEVRLRDNPNHLLGTFENETYLHLFLEKLAELVSPSLLQTHAV